MTVIPPATAVTAMSGSAPAAGHATSRGTRVRRRLVWALVVLLGVGALAAIAMSTAAPDRLLEPDDRGPNGANVLVRVLEKHGVTVDVVRSIDELAAAGTVAGSTVVMANGEYLGTQAAATLADETRGADRVVLLAPTTQQLAAMDLPLSAIPGDPTVAMRGDCTSAVARADDRVEGTDVRLVPAGGASADSAVPCFAVPPPDGSAGGSGGGGSGGEGADRDPYAYGVGLATVPAGARGPEVVVIGFASNFSNRFIDEGSDAGVAVRALGRSERLVWYQPDVSDLVGFDEDTTGPTPWPRWLGPAVALAAVAVVVLALVRGRRLGRLVPEPLPVVVRAAETTESRGRLYRRARDRDRAAAILRRASLGRLARRLAVDPHDVQAVAAASAGASGMPFEHVRALLTGPVPHTDTDLATLASALTELEEKVQIR
jgi:hypothetical protein